MTTEEREYIEQKLVDIDIFYMVLVKGQLFASLSRFLQIQV